MLPDRWRQIEDLYHTAVKLPPVERAALLARAEHAEVRRDVESLLALEPTAQTFLEKPVLAEATAGHRVKLAPGTLVGSYVIGELLGVGGMGEVYRAEDVRLRRSVAIKVLPEVCAKDPERMARFEREARLLASLNHPNIGSIYGLETMDDSCFLILELIPGESLDAKLFSDPPDAGEALRISLEIAKALEAAHDKDIIHRDLKTANVKVTPEGVVKVLDFGLAKTLRAQSSESTETATIDLTETGQILGTTAYMSPEQARGRPVDKRTDIWAFGCVLFELLAHRRVFLGETPSDVLADILGEEPDWTALPEATPGEIRTLLKRCLQKEPQKRLRDIGDARIELEEALTGPVEPASTPRRTSWSRAVAVAIACVLVGAVTAAIARVFWAPATALRPVVRFNIPVQAPEVIPPSNSPFLAISPDGSRIAYTPMNPIRSTATIYVRPIDRQEPRIITDVVGTVPFFSPDSQWLAFFDLPTRTLRKVALSGGAPVIVSRVDAAAGCTWGEDGNIVFAWFDLFVVPAAGGTPKTLLKVDLKNGDRFYRLPQYLPGGKALLFTIGTADAETFDDGRIAALDLKTGQKKILLEGGSCARYSPSGHLLYARSGKLFAVSFDARKLSITGHPFEVLDGVFMSRNTGMASYSISAGGDLVYAPGPTEGGRRLPLWVDRQGRVTPFPIPPRSYLHPRLSPDDKQLAIEVEGTTHDFYSYDLSRGVLTRLSFDGTSHWPLWTPKGDRITYRSWKTGGMTMWWMPADRSGPEEMLPGTGHTISPESWSPDGKVIAYTHMDSMPNFDVWLLATDGSKPRPLLESKFSEGSPKFSPDGRWLAYCSNESVRPEAYIVEIAGDRPGAKIQISTDGGTDPIWRRKGGEIFYRSGDKMMAVSVSTGSRLTLSKPRELWTRRFVHGSGASCGMAGVTSANYDVSADGERFVMIEDKDQGVVASQVNVVLNFGQEVERLSEMRKNSRN